MSLDAKRRNCIGGPEAEIAIRDRRIAELEAALRYVSVHLSHDTEDFDAVAEMKNGVEQALKLSKGATLPALDALLAQAKREALEAAADKAKDNERYYFTALMTEEELRQMAREVKP